jgi:hypothetical protein
VGEPIPRPTARVLLADRRDRVSGSYLTISHGTFDHRPASAVKAVRKLFTRATAPATPRGHAEIRAYFDGFDLLDPGLVFLPQWRPDGPGPLDDHPERSLNYAGVARKP